MFQVLKLTKLLVGRYYRTDIPKLSQPLQSKELYYQPFLYNDADTRLESVKPPK